MKKGRLDSLLVNRGLVASRERAKRMIMAGEVLVDEQKVDKAGALVKPEVKIRLLVSDIPYVSRGGLKLEKAIRTFPLALRGKVAADIGASTGGFTDCMLQNGVRKVFAIDVGYGQLAWKLRTDERVINMERTNIRKVTSEVIGELLDFASIDVAFISLTKVLDVAFSLLNAKGEVVALIKPQFEAGREYVGKKGVVRDPKVQEDVIQKIMVFSNEIGLVPVALTFSPVKGPEGNIEYLAHLKRTEHGMNPPLLNIAEIVRAAHTALDR